MIVTPTNADPASFATSDTTTNQQAEISKQPVPALSTGKDIVRNYKSASHNQFTPEYMEELRGKTETAEEKPAEEAVTEEKPEEAQAEAAKEASKREEFQAKARAEREKRAQEEELKPKLEEIKRMDELIAKGKEAPHKVLEAMGWSVDDFLQAIIDKKFDDLGPKKELTQEQLIEQQLEAKWKAKEEAARQAEIDRRNKELETQLSLLKEEIDQTVTAKAQDYPIVSGENLQEVVYEVWVQTVSAGNKNFTVEDAMKQVEEYEFNKLKKYQSKLVPVTNTDKVIEEAPKKTAKPIINNKVGITTADIVAAKPANKFSYKNRASYLETVVAEHRAEKAAKSK